MNNNQECALDNSLSADNRDHARSQTLHVTEAALPARRRRSTAGAVRGNPIAAALVLAAVFGGMVSAGVVGVAGEASARPPRDTVNTCTRINQDIREATVDLKSLQALEKQAFNKTATGNYNAEAHLYAVDAVKATQNRLSSLKQKKVTNAC